MSSKRQKVVNAILDELMRPRYRVYTAGAYLLVQADPRPSDVMGAIGATFDDNHQFLKFRNTPEDRKTAEFACASLNAEEIAKAIERLRGGRSL